MDESKYDIKRLTAGGEIEAAEAVKLYYTYQDYFDGLSHFLEDWSGFLRAYNPTVIVYDENERNIFLSECAQVRAVLSQLGVANALRELNIVEDAALRGDIKSLSDGLITFRAKLDIAAGIIRSAEISHHASATPPAPSDALIMAVDDNKETLNELNNLLADAYKFVALSSGQFALRALSSYTPALFIIHVEMPQLNGYELALILREDARFKETPILLLTSRPVNTLAADYLQQAAYITKPIRPVDLLRHIESYLR